MQVSRWRRSFNSIIHILYIRRSLYHWNIQRGKTSEFSRTHTALYTPHGEWESSRASRLSQRGVETRSTTLGGLCRRHRLLYSIVCLCVCVCVREEEELHRADIDREADAPSHTCTLSAGERKSKYRAVRRERPFSSSFPAYNHVLYIIYIRGFSPFQNHFSRDIQRRNTRKRSERSCCLRKKSYIPIYIGPWNALQKPYIYIFENTIKRKVKIELRRVARRLLLELEQSASS